jgi:adenosylcobinamide kinase/adenosylcobinamide-phosphate guanylyltransferase
MWILNLMDEKALLSQLKTLSYKEANIIFVLNEVTSGVIPMDKESRKFVDLTGIIGQKLTEMCDEVYEVKFGLEIRLK